MTKPKIIKSKCRGSLNPSKYNSSSLLLALHNLSYISICVATESNGLGDVNCDHVDCDDITEHGPSHEEVSGGMYT